MTDPNVTVKLNELVKKGKEGIEACQEAVNKLTLVVNQNTARLNHNSALQKLQSTDRNTFSRLRSEFKNYVRSWENKEGDFAGWRDRQKQLQDERKQTGEGIDPQGQWCKNDHGQDWETHERWVNGANVGRMNCKRTESGINQVLDREGYNAAKPKFSDWLRNKNKKPDMSECRKSNWQCVNKSDNSNKGTMRIGWGHTAGDGEWACNAWVDACKPDKCKASGIQEREGKPGPVCKDGQANINWENDTDSQNYPDDNQYPYDNQEPKFPDVQCCTNITAVAGTAQNIAQTCQQTMTNALKEVESSGSSTQGSSTQGSSTQGSSTDNTNIAIIGGLALIIILCICSFSSSVIGFMFLGGEEA